MAAKMAAKMTAKMVVLTCPQIQEKKHEKCRREVADRSFLPQAALIQRQFAGQMCPK